MVIIFKILFKYNNIKIDVFYIILFNNYTFLQFTCIHEIIFL